MDWINANEHIPETEGQPLLIARRGQRYVVGQYKVGVWWLGDGSNGSARGLDIVAWRPLNDETFDQRLTVLEDQALSELKGCRERLDGLEAIVEKLSKKLEQNGGE